MEYRSNWSNFLTVLLANILLVSYTIIFRDLTLWWSKNALVKYIHKKKNKKNKGNYRSVSISILNSLWEVYAPYNTNLSVKNRTVKTIGKRTSIIVK